MAAFDQLFGLDQSPGLGQGTMDEQPQGISPQFQDNAGELSSFADFFGKQTADSEKPPVSPEFTIKDGVIGIKGIPMETAQQIYGGFQQHQQTQAAFNAEALRLKAQEDKIRANPLLSVLSAVAAGAAQDPRMPAIVRALGYANASLNPSPDALAQKRMGILQTLAQLEQEQAGHTNAANSLQRQNRKDLVDEFYKDQDLQLKKAAAEKASEKTDQAEVDKFLKPYTAAANDPRVPRLVPHDDFMSSAVKKMDYTDAEDQYKELQRQYQATVAGKKEASTEKVQERTDIATSVAKAVLPLRTEAAVEKAVRIGNAMVPIKAATHAAMITAGIEPTVAMGKAMEGVKAETAQKISEASLPAKKEMADYAMKIAMEKAANLPLMKLAPKEVDSLVAAKQTIDYFDKAAKMVADPKYSKYLGNIRLSRLTETKLFQDLRSDEQQQIITFLAHERPRIVELSKAGARGYSPSEWPVISTLGGDTSYTPSQLQQVFRLAAQYKRDEVQAIRQIHPLAPQALFDAQGFPEAKARKVDQAGIAHFMVKNGELQAPAGQGGLSAGGYAAWKKQQGGQ